MPTFYEVTKQITDELTAAGFSVTEFQGFPLVAVPESLAETRRLLEFETSFLCRREIWAEGLILIPQPK
jgi:hypothetical protein